MLFDLDAVRSVVASSDERYRAGDLSGAKDRLRPLLADDVPYFRPYYNFGFFCWLEADYKRAIPHLEKAMQLAPNFTEGYLLLGKALTASRQHEKAIEPLQLYIAQGGDVAEALLWQSRALWGIGETEKASAIIQECAEQLGWSTPRIDNLIFSEEPWFLKHLKSWEQYLGQQFGRVNRALEIGSMEGMSAIWTAEHLLSPSGRLVLNDIEARPNLRGNLARSRYGRKIDLDLGDSSVVLPSLRAGDFDFIFVDGDHSASGVFRDCVNAAVLSSPGAFVVLDDYGKANQNTRSGIDLFLSTIGRAFDITAKDYQVFLRKTTASVVCQYSDTIRICEALTPDSAIELSRLPQSDVLDWLRRGRARIE